MKSKMIIGTLIAGVMALTANTAHAISASELLILTNQQRTTPLTINEKLTQAAYARANDMVAKQYWSHTAPDGRQAWDFIHDAGYDYSVAGENLANAQINSEAVISQWMASPTHRANIVDERYTEVGFAVIVPADYMGFQNTTLTVAMYGTQRPVTPPVETTASKRVSTPDMTETMPVPLRIATARISDRAVSRVKGGVAVQPNTPEQQSIADTLMATAFGMVLAWTINLIIGRFRHG